MDDVTAQLIIDEMDKIYKIIASLRQKMESTCDEETRKAYGRRLMSIPTVIWTDVLWPLYHEHRHLVPEEMKDLNFESSKRRNQGSGGSREGSA